jgi:hypothetical protein
MYAVVCISIIGARPHKGGHTDGRLPSLSALLSCRSLPPVKLIESGTSRLSQRCHVSRWDILSAPGQTPACDGVNPDQQAHDCSHVYGCGDIIIMWYQDGGCIGERTPNPSEVSLPDEWPIASWAYEGFKTGERLAQESP